MFLFSNIIWGVDITNIFDRMPDHPPPPPLFGVRFEGFAKHASGDIIRLIYQLLLCLTLLRGY